MGDLRNEVFMSPLWNAIEAYPPDDYYNNVRLNRIEQGLPLKFPINVKVLEKIIYIILVC